MQRSATRAHTPADTHSQTERSTKKGGEKESEREKGSEFPRFVLLLLLHHDATNTLTVKGPRLKVDAFGSEKGEREREGALLHISISVIALPHHSGTYIQSNLAGVYPSTSVRRRGEECLDMKLTSQPPTAKKGCFDQDDDDSC